MKFQVHLVSHTGALHTLHHIHSSKMEPLDVMKWSLLEPTHIMPTFIFLWQNNSIHQLLGTLWGMFVQSIASDSNDLPCADPPALPQARINDHQYLFLYL